MTEPVTEAGRGILGWLDRAVVTSDERRAVYRREIAAIEHEAVLAFLDSDAAREVLVDALRREQGYRGPSVLIRQDAAAVLAALKEAAK